MTKKKTEGWEDCSRCGNPFDSKDLKSSVISTRHEYKGRKDNPLIMSKVQFIDIASNKPVKLCKKCQNKNMQEMYMGGNWR